METWCLPASKAPALCYCMSGQLQGFLDALGQLQKSIQKQCHHSIDQYYFLKCRLKNNLIYGLSFLKFDTQFCPAAQR